MSDLSLDPVLPPTSMREPSKDRLDERLIDMRAQRYAEKTALGGFRVGARVSMFFFLGALAAAAFAVLYLQVDRRVGAAVDEWMRAQQISSGLSTIERSVNEIRVLDERYTREPSNAAAQAMQRLLTSIGEAVGDLGVVEGEPAVGDALVTVRDGFSQYAAQFSALNRLIREIGYSEDSGLLAERLAAAQDVRAKLKVIGLELSVPDFDRLHGAGATNAADTSYSALNDRLKALIITDPALEQVRAEAVAALLRHREVSGAIAEREAALTDRPPAASAIVDYVGPSLRVLSEYSVELSQRAPVAFEQERQRARRIIAGGSAGILVLLVIVGLVLMRTITRPIDRLSVAAQRLAEGDRSVVIPARGNTDQMGAIARSLDVWLDNLTEIDHLRAELDDARLRLAAEVELREAAEVADALKQDATETAEPSQPNTQAPAAPDVPLVSEEVEDLPVAADGASFSFKRIVEGIDNKGGASRGAASPIHAASEELTRFSEFVNDATRDVERTETLLRQLGDTARQIADLEQCVTTIRDEAHLLVFRSPGGNAPTENDDTLVYLAGEGRRPDNDASKRYDTIRDAVDRAERLVVNARRSLDQVSGLAQDIASDASSEALEATNKLLSQSEYLQNMLDDLVHKMRPISGPRDEDVFDGSPRSRRDQD